MLLYLVYLVIVPLADGRAIGTVNNARFTSRDLLNTESAWIENQSSAQACLCTVLSTYTDVLLFNHFTNGSCQLFFALPFTYTMLSESTATIVLLQPLPAPNQAPCCSDLNWLMTRIRSSALVPATAFNAPTYLAIDDLNYLAVMSFNDKFYRFNRTMMSQVTSRVITSSCMALTYYKGRYYIGKKIPS